MAVNSRVSKRIRNPEVAKVFRSYPTEIREKLHFLRQLIFDTAAATEGVGQLEETLKWGEPSYLTPETKSGSTVRIDWKEKKSHYAIYFKCTTNLVPTFRRKYPKQFIYEGTRAIIFQEDDKVPVKELSDCISLALTYHLRKTSSRK
jgi:hypothetical protein